MQSISLASLKLEAHHDKIINEVAQTTKLYFLSKELDFVSDFKSEAEELQISAKPRQDPHLNLANFTRKAQQLAQMLEQEVTLTRRATAHLQIQNANNFQGCVQGQYEKRVVEMGARLETIEELVQRRQEYNKAFGVFENERCVSFRERHLRLFLEKYLQKRKLVKEEIKRKLALAGKIKEKKKLLDRFALMKAKEQQLPYRCYRFESKDSRYYPNKSTDRREIDPQVGSQLRAQFTKIASKRQKSSSNKGQQTFDARHPLISALQQQIFEQATEELKQGSKKLEVKIQLLKKAIQRKEAIQTLKDLTQQQQIQTQRAKVRELLAYVELEQNFKNKLEACSYRWTVARQEDQVRRKGRSKQWTEQYEHYQEWTLLKKQRPNSLDNRSKCEAAIQRPKPQGFGSNERTNTSLERI